MLDHGFVRLDAAHGRRPVGGERRPRLVRRQPVDEMGERDQGLIRFLMRERHGTPFEHNSFRFHIKCADLRLPARAAPPDRSVQRVVGARYSQLEPEFYVPAAEDVRTQVGKPGAYTFEQLDAEAAEERAQAQRAVYEQAYATYEGMLERASRRRWPATCCRWRSTRSSTGRSTPAA